MAKKTEVHQQAPTTETEIEKQKQLRAGKKEQVFAPLEVKQTPGDQAGFKSDIQQAEIYFKKYGNQAQKDFNKFAISEIKKLKSENETLKNNTDIIPDQKKRLLDEMKSEYQFNNDEILKTSIDILVNDYGAKIQDDKIIINEFRPYEKIVSLFEFWKNRGYTPDFKKRINSKIKKYFKYKDDDGIETDFEIKTLSSRRSDINKHNYYNEFCEKIN